MKFPDVYEDMVQRGAFRNNEWGIEPIKIVVAWAQQESSENPWAVRYEPKYRWLVGSPEEGSTEWATQKTSWGLFQLMGAVLRERGFDERYLAEALKPAVNGRYAVKHLKWWKERGDSRSWTAALARYNGGLQGNRRPPYRTQEYVDSVLARVAD